MDVALLCKEFDPADRQTMAKGRKPTPELPQHPAIIGSQAHSKQQLAISITFIKIYQKYRIIIEIWTTPASAEHSKWRRATDNSWQGDAFIRRFACRFFLTLFEN